jgi:hypothetical protein
MNEIFDLFFILCFSVRCWGLGANGQLGYASTANVGDSAARSIISVRDVKFGTLVNITSISAGSYHTCAREFLQPTCIINIQISFSLQLVRHKSYFSLIDRCMRLVQFPRMVECFALAWVPEVVWVSTANYPLETMKAQQFR